MNIIVKTYNDKICFRPDTTWKERDDAAYLPEFVNSVSAAPVLFIRIRKAGRSVSAKFADRYYDAVGYGMFLYPDDLLQDGPEGFACASCMDHTTFISYPLKETSVLGTEGFGLRICKDGEELFCCPSPSAVKVEESIELASSHCYLRTGDFLAVELGPLQRLCTRDEGECQVVGYSGGSLSFDFKIVF